jgi:hypothetical protein
MGVNSVLTVVIAIRQFVEGACMVTIRPDPSNFVLLQGFPPAISQPQFKIGDQVCWHPFPTSDFGMITGLEFAPAKHLQSWEWRYTIWLDPRSPSYGWIYTDIAWEQDLKLHSTTSPTRE